jgi:hypothetical protein
MNLAPRWMPLWIALGLAAVALLWSHVTTPPERPEPSTREFVRTELDVADGVQMVLPIELPAGYDYPTQYSYDTWQIAEDTPGASRRPLAESRSAAFFPTGGTAKARLPIVIMCVQPISLKQEMCPTTSDSRNLQLRHQQTRVTVYAASKDPYDVSAWQDVELTTDLNKVTWLH